MRFNAFPHLPAEDVRCKGCGILLARIDDSGLTIRRGGLQATADWPFSIAIVCYRPSCRTLNVLQQSKDAAPRRSPE